MKKAIWLWFVRTAFKGLLAVLRYLPWPAALVLGERLGDFGYAVSARYRKVANKNLTLAFGESMTQAQRDELTRSVFRNFARAALIEFLKSPSLSSDQVKEWCRAETYAPVDALLAQGKGMVLISAHLGNWELLARRAAVEGYNVTVVARQGPDAAFNKLTDSLRANSGYHVHPRGESARTLIRSLKNGGIVAILPDQKSEDMFAPFFDISTGTVAGPAILALKTGAPIITMFAPRMPDGKYTMILGDPIDVRPTGDLQADTLRIMTEINQQVEDIIRRFPDQWLWLHDRWRVVAPAEPAADAVAAQ